MEAGAVCLNLDIVLVPAGMNEAWRIFCRPGTKFIELYECRACPVRAQRVTGVQTISKPEIYHGAGFELRTDERACPERSEGFGCKNHYEFVLGAGAKVEEGSDEIPQWRDKNRDKQLTHIVRVMVSCYLFSIYFFFN
jgi:hypothetical protein